MVLTLCLMQFNSNKPARISCKNKAYILALQIKRPQHKMEAVRQHTPQPRHLVSSFANSLA